jgi:hypothetical protein
MLALLLAACVSLASQPAGSVSDDRPPKRYQGDATVTVQFVPPARINRACHATPVCGYTVLGCTGPDGHGGRKIIMPNPNRDSHDFQGTLAHELGHWNGWPGDHRR